MLVTRWGVQAGLSIELLRDLRLLVTEVVTNAVRHAALAPGEEIELEVELDRDRLRVEVRDGGEGFDEFLPIPEAEAISGRGLYMVHRAAAAWGREPGPPFAVWFELERR